VALCSKSINLAMSSSKKSSNFFDQNMLQVVVLERILVDRVLPPDRNTLYAEVRWYANAPLLRFLCFASFLSENRHPLLRNDA
jgi:hypothetical protein